MTEDAEELKFRIARIRKWADDNERAAKEFFEHGNPLESIMMSNAAAAQREAIATAEHRLGVLTKDKG